MVEHAELEATPVSVSSSASVPEWRKEVTRKAREFGERKKVLTTPPRPLKENPNEPHAAHEPKSVKFQDLDKDEPVFIEPPPLPPPLPPVPPPAIVTPNEEISTFTPPEPIDEPVIPVIIQERRQQPRLELDLSEVVPLIEESEHDLPLHVGRRAASFVVDHSIIGVVIFVVAFLCREIFSYDLQTVNQSPVPFISGILLFHFLYYFYFWKTSRQTPGQVFFSL
ncbi:MAG TPA: RDD family protein, partial [Acidobacteriota bacterium]|nr:RDD family protein [Acidobacteriota bacterium]